MQATPSPATRQVPPLKRRGGFPVAFDNGGKTLDRFTIILSNGDILGASPEPFHPCGVGLRSGNIKTDRINGFSTIQQYLDEARAVPSWIGTEVTDLTTLPSDVQQFIRQNRVRCPIRK